MDIFNDFLEVFKGVGEMFTSLFKNWDKVEDVAYRVVIFMENISIAVLNKWFPV